MCRVFNVQASPNAGWDGVSWPSNFSAVHVAAKLGDVPLLQPRRSRSTSKICVNVKLLERYAVNLSDPHHDETVDDFIVHKIGHNKENT